jgi:hypothetical protein
MTHPPTRLGLRLRKPTDRAVTDVVAPADLREGLASLSPRHGLLPLMQSELELPAKPHPASFGPGAPFTSAGEDQAPLEFREPTKDGQHQPAVRGCRVGPSISQRSETRASLGDCIKDV